MHGNNVTYHGVTYSKNNSSPVIGTTLAKCFLHIQESSFLYNRLQRSTCVRCACVDVVLCVCAVYMHVCILCAHSVCMFVCMRVVIFNELYVY